MDNGLILVVILITAAVAASVVWLGLRRNLPPEAMAEIAAYVAAVRATIGGVASPEVVAALAGAAWDAWGSGSKYITREQFIRLVQAALDLEPAAARAIRQTSERVAV